TIFLSIWIVSRKQADSKHYADGQKGSVQRQRQTLTFYTNSDGAVTTASRDAPNAGPRRQSLWHSPSQRCVSDDAPQHHSSVRKCDRLFKGGENATTGESGLELIEKKERDRYETRLPVGVLMLFVKSRSRRGCAGNNRSTIL